MVDLGGPLIHGKKSVCLRACVCVWGGGCCSSAPHPLHRRPCSKMRLPIMLKQLVTLLHLSLSDLVTSGGFATTFFLTGGSIPCHTIPPLMMVPNSFPIFHLVLNRDLALRISSPNWFLVQSTILMHAKPLATTEFQP